MVSDDTTVLVTFADPCLSRSHRSAAQNISMFALLSILIAVPALPFLTRSYR